MNREKLQEFLAFLRKHPFCTVCSIVTLGGLLLIGFWWQGLEQLRRTHETTNREYNVMHATLTNGLLLRNELKYISDYTREIESNLVDEAELADNYAYFEALVRRSGADLEDLQEQTAPAAGKGSLYRRIPFSLRVSGDFSQVESFLHEIETGTKLGRITSISMYKQNPGSSAISLEIKLNLLGKL